MNGAAGNDNLKGGAGDDTLQGGAGEDWAIFDDKGQTQAVSIVLDASGNDRALVKNGATWENDDWLFGIENVEGGGGNDRLTGNNLANRARGAQTRRVGG
jgi:Ca2+-binding RTX toxin-like protein